MSKTRHYKAEHDGLVFTRSSDRRTYTHVVLRPCSLADQVAGAAESARHAWRINQDYHRGYADGTSEFIPVPSYCTTPKAIDQHHADVAERIQHSKTWLAKGEAGLVRDAEALAHRRWRAEFGERDTGWRYVGWCGRADLARKQAKPGDVIIEAVLL